ncbi:MAG: TetR/AcrR family transcriptional regulator, partial [Blastochloris sp.]|nr:TetR/AcrR family transcriptional regulator [Blastochloris sp.]
MSTNGQESKKTEKPRVDRRIQRTRTLLRDALISLILEREDEGGYDSITIQDITDRANLSRATFYLRFRDKDDLYLQSVSELYDELVARIPPLSPDDMRSDGVPPSLAAFRHAAENSDLYRVVL